MALCAYRKGRNEPLILLSSRRTNDPDVRGAQPTPPLKARGLIAAKLVNGKWQRTLFRTAGTAYLYARARVKFHLAGVHKFAHFQGTPLPRQNRPPSHIAYTYIDGSLSRIY